MKNYFESSYLAYELTSCENSEFISGVFEHLEYLEENDTNTWKNADTSDYFFNQRPIGGGRPFSISDLNISKTDLISILLNHDLVSEENIDFIDDQQMEEYQQQMRDANCFSNSSYAIFFSAANNVVEYIWLDYEEDFSMESDRLAICQLLNYLGEKYSLCLIDWYSKKVIDLSSKEMVTQYLNDIAGNRDFSN